MLTFAAMGRIHTVGVSCCSDQIGSYIIISGQYHIVLGTDGVDVRELHTSISSLMLGTGVGISGGHLELFDLFWLI